MQPEHFAEIRRDYGPADVERLAGSFPIRHTLAEMGAARLRHLLDTEPFVPTLGALTGNQAVQQVKAGLKAIYLSGWQVAADANTAQFDKSESPTRPAYGHDEGLVHNHDWAVHDWAAQD